MINNNILIVVFLLIVLTLFTYIFYVNNNENSFQNSQDSYLLFEKIVIQLSEKLEKEYDPSALNDIDKFKELYNFIKDNLYKNDEIEKQYLEISRYLEMQGLFPHSIDDVIIKSVVYYKNRKVFKLNNLIYSEKRKYRTNFGFCKDDVFVNGVDKESITPYLIRNMKQMGVCCSESKKTYILNFTVKGKTAQNVEVEEKDEVGKCLENVFKGKKISIKSVDDASFQLNYICPVSNKIAPEL